MDCYRIKDWDKYYETSETRKLKRMTWIPVQNKHDGKGFRRIMRRPDGLEILGAFLVILEVASRCPQRGLLEDQDGPLGSQEISDKTGAPEEALSKAFQVLASKEIGWIEVVISAGTPADSPAIPAEAPGTPGTNRREWKGMEGNGHTQVEVCDEAETAGVSGWPKFAAAITGRFPTASRSLVNKIAEEAIREFPALTDENLVSAFLAASESTRNQYSPALYVQTIPAVIRSWKA